MLEEDLIIYRVKRQFGGGKHKAVERAEGEKNHCNLGRFQ